MSHNSYVGPPDGFKAMNPIKAPIASYNYLQTDVALPHPVDKDKTSEAQVSSDMSVYGLNKVSIFVFILSSTFGLWFK